MVEKYIKVRKVSPTPYVYTLYITPENKIDFIGEQIYTFTGDFVDTLIKSLQNDTIIEIIDCYDKKIIAKKNISLPLIRKKRGEK